MSIAAKGDRARSTDLSRPVEEHLPLSSVDLHILLVLIDTDLYGYALLERIGEDSDGQVTMDLGALYRALARLSRDGLVEEVAPPADAEVAPGRPRRWYGSTELGARVARAEVRRLRALVDLGEARLVGVPA